MQFALPSTLAEHLLDYDDVHRERQQQLKKQQEQAAAAERRQRRSSVNSRPLGMPIGIIPADIVPAEELERALKIINAASTENRHEHWLTDTGQFRAAIWHLTMPEKRGSCWMAAWANPERNGCYVRVMAKESCAPSGQRTWYRSKIRLNPHGGVAYSNQSEPLFPSTDEQVASGLWTKIKLPRATWWQRTWFFDERSVASDPDFIEPEKLIDLTANWSRRSAAASYQFRGQTALRVMKYCADFLGIPERDEYGRAWYSPFASCQKTPFLLACDHGCTPRATDETLTDLILNWRPSIADLRLSEQDNTPFFRSHFTKRITAWLELCDTFPRNLDEVGTAWKSIANEREDLAAIHNLWPDITRDHVQSLFTASIDGNSVHETYASHLRSHCLHYCLAQGWTVGPMDPFLQAIDTPGPRWIRENVPIETWIRWCQLDQRDELRRALAGLLGLIRVTKDEQDYVIPRPNRWRLEEVVNLFEEQQFLRTTPNEALPQDLFPQPVKVLVNDTKYTFFQPINTHQLHAWGSAVRNCVGNGSYADRIKRHRAFIVLAQVDNKPIFTVQLSLRNGTLLVDQLVGVANQRPSSEEQATYQEAMRQALELRAASLTSDSLASV